MKILLIIPTLNEEKSIEKLINKLKFLIKKTTILFVDDKSTDNTRLKIKKFKKKYKNIKYLFRNQNPGIGASIKDGYKYAIEKKFDICITMDADGTHNPKKISLMINIIKSGKYDIVSTNRFFIKSSTKKWPLSRLLLTKIRYYLVSFLLKTKIDFLEILDVLTLIKLKKNIFYYQKIILTFF